MFIIKYTDGTYFHNKGRIILYETPNQAARFLEGFIQYAINNLAQQGCNPARAMPFLMMFQAQCQIMNIDFDINNVECGTVYATDL